MREDQPFVAPNDVSLRQADEANAEQPGAARPFAIYPIGENEFGRKSGMLKLKFGDSCVMFDDLTCKKL